jgi:hypothetical protein
LRSKAAFPLIALLKAVFLTVLVVLCFVNAAAEASRESGAPKPSGYLGRRHTRASLERAKVRHASTSTNNQARSVAAKRKRAASAARRARGQRSISSERARQIQSALIREHYLDGKPSGVWDQRTKNAMIRYQAENGWKTKITPDSRALIKLGLGPRHEGLLNPDSAALGSPHELSAERETPKVH